MLNARDPMDDGLFEQARSGDDQAWEVLFRQCYPKVVRVVRRRLNQSMRSVYDSTDFASDVWRSLLAKSDRFEFPNVGALQTFLARAAEQKVIDAYRKMMAQKRDVSRNRPLDPNDDDNSGGLPASLLETPSQFAQANERWEQTLKPLNEEQRRVLEMARQGYPNLEIAQAVGWSIRKVQRELQQLGKSWKNPDVG